MGKASVVRFNPLEKGTSSRRQSKERTRASPISRQDFSRNRVFVAALNRSRLAVCPRIFGGPEQIRYRHSGSNRTAAVSGLFLARLQPLATESPTILTSRNILFETTKTLFHSEQSQRFSRELSIKEESRTFLDELARISSLAQHTNKTNQAFAKTFRCPEVSSSFFFFFVCRKVLNQALLLKHSTPFNRKHDTQHNTTPNTTQHTAQQRQSWVLNGPRRLVSVVLPLRISHPSFLLGSVSCLVTRCGPPLMLEEVCPGKRCCDGLGFAKGKATEGWSSKMACRSKRGRCQGDMALASSSSEQCTRANGREERSSSDAQFRSSPRTHIQSSCL